MIAKKDLDNYWTCQYCGEDTSKELKSELCGIDHWDCIMDAIIFMDSKKEDNEKQG
jgi:hypothetical protein